MAVVQLGHQLKIPTLGAQLIQKGPQGGIGGCRIQTSVTDQQQQGLGRRIVFSQQRAEALAERYWAPSRDVTKIRPENIEVLVGGSLYFPQWETFEPMDMQSLIRLGMVRQMEETLLGMQFKVDRASLDHYLQTWRNLTTQDLAAGLGPNSGLTPAGSGGSKA